MDNIDQLSDEELERLLGLGLLAPGLGAASVLAYRNTLAELINRRLEAAVELFPEFGGNAELAVAFFAAIPERKLSQLVVPDSQAIN